MRGEAVPAGEEGKAAGASDWPAALACLQIQQALVFINAGLRGIELPTMIQRVRGRASASHSRWRVLPRSLRPVARTGVQPATRGPVVLARLGSAAYVVRTGSVTPKPPAFRDSKKRPMVLALWPPVRAIPVMARQRYDNVRVRVPVCDRRSVTRFVRSRANQCRARECTDNPPHVSPFFTPLRSSP